MGVGSLFSCHSTCIGAAQDMLEENICMLAVKQAGRWKSDRMPSRYGKDSYAQHFGYLGDTGLSSLEHAKAGLNRP